MCEYSVNMCALARNTQVLLPVKKYVAVFSNDASLKLIEPHMYAHTHMHMLIQEAGVLCGCHGNSGPLLSPPPHFSNPPLPFVTIC